VNRARKVSVGGETKDRRAQRGRFCMRNLLNKVGNVIRAVGKASSRIQFHARLGQCKSARHTPASMQVENPRFQKCQGASSQWFVPGIQFSLGIP
jgi:hypothetical protein